MNIKISVKIISCTWLSFTHPESAGAFSSLGGNVLKEIFPWQCDGGIFSCTSGMYITGPGHLCFYKTDKQLCAATESLIPFLAMPSRGAQVLTWFPYSYPIYIMLAA